jgi:hypothetical protein
MPGPEPKKRLCPECDKEFTDDGEITETPCCKFRIRLFDEIERIDKAKQKQAEKKDAEEKDKKKKTRFGENLGRL